MTPFSLVKATNYTKWEFPFSYIFFAVYIHTLVRIQNDKNSFVKNNWATQNIIKLYFAIDLDLLLKCQRKVHMNSVHMYELHFTLNIYFKVWLFNCIFLSGPEFIDRYYINKFFGTFVTSSFYTLKHILK